MTVTGLDQRAPESVFPRLEPKLPSVQKPIQYVGGELNSTLKDWDCAPDGPTVRWALMYPDAYEVGLPNQGVQILYEVLNERDWILAERTYSVWPDMEKVMRAGDAQGPIPQFTVDNHRPVRAFDVLGLSFSTELGYTNMLNALDLAGIPLHAVDRTDADPIVLAGGHAAFNPEPVADFLDAAVLGDGEEIVLEISELIREWKAEGRPGGRDEVLARLAASGGVYVPKFYDVSYDDSRRDRLRRTQPAGCPRPGPQAHADGSRLLALPGQATGAARRDGPRAVLRRDLPRLHPRVPLLSGRHDHPTGARTLDRDHREHGGERHPQVRLRGGRAAVPVERRPQRDRRGRQGTGRPLRGLQHLVVSLPSTRVDAFNVTLANEFSRNGRRSGLTFAPEGGSERLRKVINKMVTEEDLIRTVATAFSHGWRQVKLYFMCGLPTETDEDVLEIADLARKVIAKGREVSGRNDIRCTVSIGGFVPKPHTPFQWAAQLDHETTDERLKKLRDNVRADKKYGRAIGFRYHDGKPGIVEGLLSRGDRRVGAVIEQVWRDGGRFDGWSEHFSYDRWMTATGSALDGSGVDLDWFTTRERDYDEVLPWDHLDSGLDKDWLWADWEDALSIADDPSSGVEVEDCRWTPCYDCGVCPEMNTEIQIGPTGHTLLPLSVV